MTDSIRAAFIAFLSETFRAIRRPAVIMTAMEISITMCSVQKCSNSFMDSFYTVSAHESSFKSVFPLIKDFLHSVLRDLND